jgi:hypothetical protein
MLKYRRVFASAAIPINFRGIFKSRTMATLGAYEKRHKVTVVGSGNW